MRKQSRSGIKNGDKNHKSVGQTFRNQQGFKQRKEGLLTLAQRDDQRSNYKVLVVPLIVASICVISVVAYDFATFQGGHKPNNETLAIKSLGSINASQASYLNQDPNHRYGTLKDLEKNAYIDNVLGSGTKEGYIFEIGVSPDPNNNGYWVKASPSIPGQTGNRFFFTNQTGIIFFTVKNFRPGFAADGLPEGLRPIGSK